MADDNSRALLRKKILDRWENEGGKTAAEGIEAPENSPPLSRESPPESPSPLRNKQSRGLRSDARSFRQLQSIFIGINFLLMRSGVRHLQ
jgi:hypothetical protein